MVRYYCIAGHLFAVRSADGNVWMPMTNYAPFEVTDPVSRPLFELDIVDPSDSLSCSEEREPFVIDSLDEPDMPRVDVYRQGDGWLFEFYPNAVSKFGFGLWVDNGFSHGRIHSWNVKQFGRYPIDNALMILYVMATADKNTIGIHASVIVHSGKAHIFLGESGTGKSTHSRLWLQNIAGSHLLNDDNPVVKVGDDGVVRVYGTPWSGKTPCYLNESAPVAAFVELAQENENRIHKLKPIESYIVIEASSSGVRQIPAVEEGLFQTLKTIVEQVHCYHLDCLPDAAAARLCAATCGIDMVETMSPETMSPESMPDGEVVPVIGIPRLKVGSFNVKKQKNES